MLIPLLKKAKDDGKKAILTYNKLKIDGKSFVYDHKADKIIQVQSRYNQDRADEYGGTHENNQSFSQSHYYTTSQKEGSARDGSDSAEKN